MTEIENRIYQAKTQEEMDLLVSDLYGTKVNCEGTVEERFIAGWVNAKDTQDERHRPMTDEEFVRYVMAVVNY